MSARFDDCKKALDSAVADLFSADPQIQVVGIARHERGFGFKAVKNEARIIPASLAKESGRVPKSIKKIPVVVETVAADIEPVLTASLPLAASFVPEQSQHRPLVCGLQVQNVDDDNRQRAAGQLQPGFIIIGTLGCFVTLPGGGTAALSNNHVLAGENRGVKQQDRILQPGNLTFVGAQHVATLTDFVPLNPSPATARPARGNVVFNAADAAVAELAAGVNFTQGYLPLRNLPNPVGVGTPRVGDVVYKVGRTTGLTHGTVTAVGAVVGPVGYAPGNCWFNDQFEVTGVNGTLFSDQGDSGSAILNAAGEVVGLLFAGNGTHTYATPIQAALGLLNCTLA